MVNICAAKGAKVAPSAASASFKKIGNSSDICKKPQDALEETQPPCLTGKGPYEERHANARNCQALGKKNGLGRPESRKADAEEHVDGGTGRSVRTSSCICREPD